MKEQQIPIQLKCHLFWVNSGMHCHDNGYSVRPW